MKNNKGITLVALVITIIVLLILAGVSLSLVMGENGILNQATRAKTKTDMASAKEELQLEISAYEIAKLTGETTTLEDYLEDKGYNVQQVEYGLASTTATTIYKDDKKFMITPTGNLIDENTIELSVTRITYDDFHDLGNNCYIYRIFAYTPKGNNISWRVENSPPDPNGLYGDYMYIDQSADNFADVEVRRDKYNYGEIKVTAYIPETEISATCIVDTTVGSSGHGKE